MGLGQFLDRRIVLPLLPGLAARRVRARLRYEADSLRYTALSTYAAAEKSRLTQDWKAPRRSADDALVPDAPLTVARARQACRDEWAGFSGRSSYLRHIVGTGITCKAAARDPQSGQDLADFNRAADRLWLAWCREPAYLDVERRRTMLAMQRTLVAEFFTAGEALVVLGYEKGREDQVGLVLQAVEPELLDWMRTKNETTGNQVRGGIEVDAHGAAVAYWLFLDGHPLEAFRGKSTRVPAERVLHWFDPLRIRQTHGESRLGPVMIKLRHLNRYDEAEVIAKRMEACIGAFIKQNPDLGDVPLGTQAPAGSAGQDARGTKEIHWEPGMLPRLGPDEDIALVNPQRPGATYDPFLTHQEGMIAAGMDLDRATLARDFSKANYSGQRQGRLEVWDALDPLQTLCVDLVLRPLRNEFIRLAVAEGRLAAPRWFEGAAWRAAYLDAEWKGPPKRWIDMAREMAAIKLGIDYRLITRREVRNEQSGDYREDFHQIADERTLADELGFTLPEDALGGPGTSPSEPRPGADHSAPDGMRRRRAGRHAGGNGDGLAEAILAATLREDE